MRSDFSSKNEDESNTIIATRTEDYDDDVESSYQVHDPVIHLEIDEEQ